MMVGDCCNRRRTVDLAASQRLAGGRDVGLRAVGSRLLVFLLFALAGCADDQPPSTASNTPAGAASRPSVALRVAVVNEPELAAAIGRLSGEWAERFGGTLTAEAKSWKEVAAAETIDADVIIFPSRYLGELCVSKRLRPVRNNVLRSDTVDTDDYFPLVRPLISWDRQVMALPLGVDLPTSRETFDHQRAISLLVEVAPAAGSRGRVGVLFDPQTMKPRITQPLFVDAMKRLPNSNGARSVAVPRVPVLGMPVLGVGDRLAAVTTASRNAASAFKLLAWLAGPEISSQLARAGNGTMPVRQSLASSPAWYDPRLTAGERNVLGKAIVESLSSQQCLLIPRIPGVDEYLAALERAVHNAVSGGIDPKAALEQASTRWETITDALGRDAQRQAYRKHLGISSP